MPTRRTRSGPDGHGARPPELRGRPDAWVPAALVALALGMTASAIAGPLALDVVRFAVSPNMVNQLVGGEVVSLVVVTPIAIVAAVLWTRGASSAFVLAMAPALYAVYIYVQFIAGPQYGRYPGNSELLFPLYLGLVILGWLVAWRAWGGLQTVVLPPLGRRLRRTVAALIVLPNAVFALAWIASIVQVVGADVPPSAYADDETLFWLIRLMDLGAVIPIGIGIAVGLFRDRSWATRAAYAFVGFQALIGAAVAGMAIVMAVRDDPSADLLLLVVATGFSVALTIAFVIMLRALWTPHGLKAVTKSSVKISDQVTTCPSLVAESPKWPSCTDIGCGP